MCKHWQLTAPIKPSAADISDFQHCDQVNLVPVLRMRRDFKKKKTEFNLNMHSRKLLYIQPGTIRVLEMLK